MIRNTLMLIAIAVMTSASGEARDDQRTEAARLLAEWRRLQREETMLLSAARKVVAERRTLAREKALLRAEVDGYNAQCAGRVLPEGAYRTCEAKRVRLESAKANHNARIDHHNARAERVWRAIVRHDVAARRWRIDWARLRRRLRSSPCAGISDPEALHHCLQRVFDGAR